MQFNISKSPIFIGVTPDDGKPGETDQDQSYDYAKVPWYVVRKNYCESVAKHGAVPILLPYYKGFVDNYLDLCSAIIVTGGGFDVDPALFGATQVHETVVLKPERTSFEYELITKAYQRQMPILGICGGMQLLNVVLGGTLVQHIPDEINEPIVHKTDYAYCKAGHDVALKPNTTLHQIIGRDTFAVNTNHHQAIKNVAPCLRVNAFASDGVIEGVESVDYSGCLGLQWHPEHYVNPCYDINEQDELIFKWFVDKAKEYNTKKS